MNAPRMYAQSVSNPDRAYRVRVRRDRRDPNRIFINSGPACFTLDHDNARRLADQIHDLADQTP